MTAPGRPHEKARRRRPGVPSRRRALSQAAGSDYGPGAAPRALDALYDAHYRSLVRVCALLVNDITRAEEVVQAAFADVGGGWQGRPGSDTALRYLQRAVVRRARSARLARPAAMAAEGTGPPAAAAALTPLTGPPLTAALRKLPALQREALVLRYYAGLGDAQIADVMGIRQQAVGRTISRGLTRLHSVVQSGASAGQ